MINPSVKIASIAMGAGGIITGGAVGIYQMTQSKQEDKKDKSESTSTNTPKLVEQSIETLLTGVKLLGEAEEDKETWTEKWKAFKQEHNDKEPVEPWKIENWSQKKENDTGLAEFKRLCETNSKAKVEGKGNKLYIAVEKHCTKPVTDSSTGLSPAT